MSDNHHSIYLLLTACFIWKMISLTIKQLLYFTFIYYVSRGLLLLKIEAAKRSCMFVSVDFNYCVM